MYVNRKMIPAETIPGMRVGVVKENGGWDEFKYGIFAILQEVLYMPQCTPTQDNNKKKKKRKKVADKIG
jgi:hypothetical protein